MLVELRVGEQRYRAVWEVLDGRLGDRGGAPVRGVAAERCTPGCAGMPPRVGWAVG